MVDMTARRKRGRPKGAKNKSKKLSVSFQNNPRLKKPGVQYQLSEEQVTEYIKCSQDPIYFIENYVKFMTVDRGIVNIQLYDWQKRLITAYHENRKVILKTGRQLGKALSLDTPIPTPTGWTTMGDIKIGDKVLGADGKPTTVVLVTDVMLNHECYKVTLDSGIDITADAEHLWEVTIRGKKYVKNTRELSKILLHQEISIEKQKAVKYLSISPLPIDPYVFGLQLGNGIVNNKRIPGVYKRSSIVNRQELIRGLLDSGYLSQPLGSPLLNDIREIFASLGIKTQINNGKLECSTGNHYIKDIQPTGSVPVKCIQVDSADHLYLCSKHFIPTHNTSSTTGYLLHLILFNRDYTVGVLAQKQKMASEILDRLKTAMEFIPLWMQQGIVTWNETMIELETNSRILCESTASGSIRGFTLNCVYADELSFVPQHIAEDFFTSVYPTISSGTTSKCLITSTPFGYNLFYRLWCDAVKQKTDPKHWNGFVAIEANWREVPGRTQKWADEQRIVLGDQKYQQDVEAEFQGSQHTLIAGNKLRSMSFIPPINTVLNEKCAIYAAPVPGHAYCISADSSEGKGLDFSVFCVVDVTQAPYRVVAVYRDNFADEIVFSQYIFQTAQHYNQAYVIAENNAMGALVLHHLIHDLDYDNLFFSQTNEHGETSITGPGAAKKPGFRTTPRTKTQACLHLKTLIETDQLIVQDFDMVAELSTFVLQKNKSWAAEEGYHDDTVASLFIFAWLTAQPFFKDISDLNLRARLYAEKERQAAEQLPPATVVEGPFEKPVPKFEVTVDGVTRKKTLWVPAEIGYDQALGMLNEIPD